MLTLLEDPRPQHPRFIVRITDGTRLWSGSGPTAHDAQIDAERLMPIRPWLYVTPA